MAKRNLSRPSRKCRRGIAMPMMAILIAVFLAFAGLVLDGGLIYFEKRRMQFAADAGSYAGAHELFRGNMALIDSGARNDTRLNLYEHGEDQVDVQVNHPPSSGPHQDDRHVEVIISKPMPAYFMRVLNFEEVNVRARAVSGIVQDNSPVCVLSLNPTADPGFVINGGASLMTDCRIQVNSGEGRGMRVNGGSSEPYCLTGDEIGVSGGFSGNEDCINIPVTEGSMPVWDPYYPNTYDPFTHSMTGPSIEQQALDAMSLYAPQPLVEIAAGDDYCGPNALSPGYYQGIHMTGGCLEFSPGFYATDGLLINGGFVTGGPPVNTPDPGGVTIYNTALAAQAVMRGINISANAEVHLSATKAGDGWCCDDFLFINSINGDTQNQYDGFVCGNSVSTYEGRLYFPTVDLNFCGTAQADAYLELVADEIVISGTVDVNATGIRPGSGPSKFKVGMVE